MLKQPRQTTLAIDPGLRDLGWAVFRDGTLVDASVKTFRFTRRSERHAAALTCVRTWVDRYRVSTIVLESTRPSRQPSLALLHRWTRSVLRLAQRRGLLTAVYDVQQVRKALLGTGWGSKRDAAVLLAARYPPFQMLLRQDRAWKERYFHNMFDAIALGLHHRSQR